MAQEPGTEGITSSSTPPTNVEDTTFCANEDSFSEDGGTNNKRTSVIIADTHTTGVAERHPKTGVSLTISPPTTLDLDCANKENEIQDGEPHKVRSNNGSISSDVVFVESSAAAAAAAAAIRAKGPLLSTHEEEVFKN